MSFFGGSSSHGANNNNHSSSPFNQHRPTYARSSSSFFSRTGGGSSSHYKRRPRDGYVAYLVAKLRRLIADLWTYARRHPVKAFFAIVVPLVSAGGALHELLKQFGVRLPASLEAFGAGGGAGRYRGGYYGSQGYGGGGGGGSSGDMGGLAGLATGAGALGAAGSLFKIAQAFM